MSKNDPIIASCHCGGVTIEMPRTPDYIGECNCSLCARIGGRWGYYNPAEVDIQADELGSYVREDMDPPTLATHFCQNCACTTHWTALPGHERGRLGVNMRMVEDGLLDGVPVRLIDGKRL